MSATRTRYLEDILNGMSPAANMAQLGTLLEELLTQHNALRALTEKLYADGAMVVSPASLAIKAADSALVKSSAAYKVNCGGVVVTDDADQDMAALSGNVADNKSAVYAFYIDSGGTLTSAKGNDADDEVGAVAALPATPANKALLGYVIVTNASGGAFTGGTTALDATGITATYVNTETDADATALALLTDR